MRLFFFHNIGQGSDAGTDHLNLKCITVILNLKTLEENILTLYVVHTAQKTKKKNVFWDIKSRPTCPEVISNLSRWNYNAELKQSVCRI